MTDWLDAKAVATRIGVPLNMLRRLARRGEFPELLHVARGVFRVRRIDYEAWEQARMTSAEMAREELQAERVKAAMVGRA